MILLQETGTATGEEDFLDTALKRMKISQKLVKQRLREAKAKNREYQNARCHAQPRDFDVGDAVFLYNFVKKDKFDPKWMAGYRIIKKTGPVSFVVEHEASGRTHRVHVDVLRHDKRQRKTPEKVSREQVSCQGRQDPESCLGPKESPTGVESDTPDEGDSGDSLSEDSDATEIYEYDSEATEIYEPELYRRPKRNAEDGWMRWMREFNVTFA